MKIPTNEVRGSLTTEAPAVQIAPDTLGQSGKNLEVMGQAVAQSAEKVKKVYDDTTALKAQTEMSNGINQLKTEMLTDPNLNANRESYLKRFNTLRDNALKGVGDAQYRSQLQSKFDLEQGNFNFDFNRESNKQIVEQTKGQLFELNNAQDQEYVNANPVRQEILVQERRDRYQHMVKTGVMGADDAVKAYVEDVRKMRKSVILQDIQNDAEGTFKNLQSGYYDSRGLDPRDKADLMEKARTQHKNNIEAKNVLVQSNQEQNELDILKKITTPGGIMDPVNGIKLDKLSEDVQFGDLSQKTYESVVKGLSNPKAINGTAVTDPETLKELTIAQNNPLYSRKSLREDLMQAWAEGKLSTNDLARMGADPGGLKQVGVDAESEKARKYQEGQKIWMNWVKNFSSTPQESFVRLFRQYSDQIRAKGIDVALDVATNIIRQEAVRQNPQLAGHKDLPNNVMDAEGGFKSVYQQKSEKAPDLMVGADTVLITKQGVTKKIPAANKARAIQLGWKVEASGPTSPENKPKPGAKK